jgi:hypothetical protein
MADTTNISTLVSPDIVKNLKASIDPKAFGDQLKDKAKDKLIQAATNSPLVSLYKEKANLVKEGIELEIKHSKTLLELEVKHTPSKKIQDGQTVEIAPILDDEQYQNAVINENGGTLSNGKIIEGAYLASIKDLNERKAKNQDDINTLLKDPFAKQKAEIKKRKESLKNRKKKTKEEEKKAKKALTKSILSNAKKTLVPILTLVLTNKIAEVIAQNDTIKKLVDDTNKIITDANTSGDKTQLDNAKLVRDNAITVIQSNEKKINDIITQINNISIYISIFSTIISIISSIPIPTSTGVPGVPGIFLSLILKFVTILEKANKIVISLSAFLPTILVVLDKAISILQDYKSQLLNINGSLEAIASTIPNLNNGLNFGTNFGSYKGFTFALKEEDNSKFNVRGNKRHYAVAINRSGVETVKSDYSFTQDPDNLIEQLKLIIDQQNLQG